MDLGTTPRSTAAVLSELRAGVQDREALVVREWVGIVEWASAHVVAGPEGAATITEGYLDTGVPIAGEGAPLVSEFGLMELVAVLGRSPDGGRAYVGRVIECAWRLPHVYDAVVAGRLAPWRAERIAERTHSLNAEAAGFVDRQLFDATGVGWAQLDRLISEAVLRFDPATAEAERAKAADARRFDIDPNVDDHGLVAVSGLLDAADGHDLNLAVARRAEVLGRLGDESSLDVRRSKAAAELARADLALDLLIPDPDTGETGTVVPGRRVELNVHITDATLRGENPVGRWEQGNGPISSEQIREWLRTHDTTITVRPVIDLTDHVPVTSYEVPDRHKRAVALRDHTCRFPHCTRPATRCDIDHATPHAQGGVTCPCNEVPLCRRHHRAKTHSAWRYDTPTPGTYVWTSPHGHAFRVDHRGTHPLHTAPPPDE
ncbi:HNH endonuclease [Nocardioides sp. R1-1]|uniref:HNH endonuclease signature motif containing protein n=1 Tax=Nocardioides sp. R1-1 TaxID=3383502 RepID=UPI0038D07EAD